MRNIYTITTPENIKLEYELAGVGSRMLAVALDTLIQWTFMVVVYLVMLLFGFGDDFFTDNLGKSNSIVIAFSFIVLFFIFFYFCIIFYIFFNGQTPGKRVVGLQVINSNGEPINFFASVVRNIVRIVDMIPFGYLVGGILVVFSKNYKRIGDMAANTIVVKNKPHEIPLSIDLLEHENKNELYRISEKEKRVLKSFLERAKQDKLGDRKVVFEYHLNTYFMKKFNMSYSPYNNVYQFLEDILKSNWQKGINPVQFIKFYRSTYYGEL